MLPTDPPSRPVTISVVSHGQWRLLRPLLQQLDTWCSGWIDSVVLTVNVPEPLEPDPGWRFPVHRIDNAIPRGFGANHNAAFRRCRTPWFLVLNPDIRIDSDILGALLAGAEDPIGLLAPRILEPGCTQPEAYRGLLTPLELVGRRTAGHRPPREPAWVAGMFMLLRSRAFDSVGGFDERFFMYCEDFDLCARLRLAGWSLRIRESLLVMHEAQRASNSSLRPLGWHLASFARVWTSGAFWRYWRLLRIEARRRADTA
jgi:GT2 family glycosyltransferase